MTLSASTTDMYSDAFWSSSKAEQKVTEFCGYFDFKVVATENIGFGILALVDMSNMKINVSSKTIFFFGRIDDFKSYTLVRSRFIRGEVKNQRSRSRENICFIVDLKYSDASHADIRRKSNEDAELLIVYLSFNKVFSADFFSEASVNLIKEIKKIVPLKEISSYQYHGPTQENMFFGRIKEIRNILHKRSANFAIVSGRRFGKTSILIHLINQFMGILGTEPIFISTISKKDPHALLLEIIRKLDSRGFKICIDPIFKKMLNDPAFIKTYSKGNFSDVFTGKGDFSPVSELEGMSESKMDAYLNLVNDYLLGEPQCGSIELQNIWQVNVGKLKGFFKYLYEKNNKKPTILFLDEIDNIVEWAYKNHDYSFFEQLRDANSEGYCQIIVTGYKWLYRAYLDQGLRGEGLIGNPLFNFFEIIELHNLAKHDAKALIEIPMRHLDVKMTDDAVGYIIKQTGCQPSFIQFYCKEICDALADLEGGAHEVNLEFVKSVEKGNKIANFFNDNLEFNTSALEHLIIHICAEMYQRGQVEFNCYEIDAILKSYGIRINNRELLKEMVDLELSGFMKRNGHNICFSYPLLPDLLISSGITKQNQKLVEDALINFKKFEKGR